MFHLGRFFTLAGGRRIPDAKTTTPRQEFPYGHVSRSHALDRGTGWDGLGRLVGRVQHRDRSMFIEVGTTGRLVRGVRVWVAAGPANNSRLHLRFHPSTSQTFPPFPAFSHLNFYHASPITDY